MAVKFSNQGYDDAFRNPRTGELRADIDTLRRGFYDQRSSDSEGDWFDEYDDAEENV